MMLNLLYVASMMAIIVWILCGQALTVPQLRESRLIRTVFFELRPFYLPAVVAGYVLDSIDDGTPVGAWRIFVLAIQVLNWFLYKDKGGDDDRWKRRGRKVAERVTQQGSRLVVVPEATP